MIFTCCQLTALKVSITLGLNDGIDIWENKFVLQWIGISGNAFKDTSFMSLVLLWERNFFLFFLSLFGLHQVFFFFLWHWLSLTCLPSGKERAFFLSWWYNRKRKCLAMYFTNTEIRTTNVLKELPRTSLGSGHAVTFTSICKLYTIPHKLIIFV